MIKKQKNIFGSRIGKRGQVFNPKNWVENGKELKNQKYEKY